MKITTLGIDLAKSVFQLHGEVREHLFEAGTIRQAPLGGRQVVRTRHLRSVSG